MAEPLRPFPESEAELERALRALGAQVAYPPTPDLTARVRPRLHGQPARPSPWTRLWDRPLARPLAIALLALLFLCSATLVFSPAALRAVAERLGLAGIRIEYVPAVPTATPTAIGATPVPIGARLSLGTRVSLEQAQESVAYRVHQPSLPELGSPDEVYLLTPPPGGMVSLVYRERPGLPATRETGVALLFTQFSGDVPPELIGKGIDVGKEIGRGTKLERVTVNGGRGYWIEGDPHLFLFRDARGQVREETVRLAGNTLIWEQDGLTFRLEGAPDKETALRVAASVR